MKSASVGKARPAPQEGSPAAVGGGAVVRSGRPDHFRSTPKNSWRPKGEIFQFCTSLRVGS
jgi:hypothetical protein